MISKLLLFIGIVCLSIYGFVTVQAYMHQAVLRSTLNEEIYHPLPANTSSGGRAPVRRRLQDGDLFGQLEIPRLNMSVMVMEGDEDNILRLGAGHVPGTPMAIAGHRDTFFRPLKDIKLDDTIRLTTPDGTTEYRVISTKIVKPEDTGVLDENKDGMMTLVTCYPFYYVGPAPQRFIVEAVKN